MAKVADLAVAAGADSEETVSDKNKFLIFVTSKKQIMNECEILYRDKYFIAVNNPNGILVHRTKIAEEDSVFLLQIVRDLTGEHLYPVHRLDRPTSGVLLFAFDSQTARILSEMLVSGDVTKQYTALVRGWFPDEVDLDNPVKNDRGNLQQAHTIFRNISHFTLDHPVGNFAKARYSVIDCFPKSGRWHQIRQHLAHLRHYIINDRVHGDGKHNKIFKHVLNIEPLFLHAASKIGRAHV